MSVSVVIPAFNAKATLREAVRSAVDQTERPREVIVVDDGSTDGSTDTIEQISRLVRIIRQRNQGVSVARNTAITATQGDWIAFLDADDVWHPRKLEVQLQYLRRHSEIGLVASDRYDWPGDTPRVDPLEVPAEPLTLDSLLVKNRITTSTVMVRKSLLDEAGEFDASLLGPEDYDMWLRIVRRSPAAMVRLPLAGYRETEGSLSKNADRIAQGVSAILSRNFSEETLPGRGWFKRRSWAVHRYGWAWLYYQQGNRQEAFAQLIRSLWTFPWLCGRDEIQYRFGRLRLLAAVVNPWRNPAKRTP